MARLRRSDCSGPGLRRQRSGRGFVYRDADGERVTEPEVLARIDALVIPPAWTEVWICTDPLGHLQATGIDAVGRKQYLYHPVWRIRRDREKFREMEGFARALPRLRRQLRVDLDREPLDRARVLACSVRLLDVGLFRIGSDDYADQGGGLGLATVRREHVSFVNGTAVFDYPAKSGVRRHHTVSDPLALALVEKLARRRSGPDELLAYRERGGAWHRVHSDDINAYLKDHLDRRFSAKDFRTWNATVLAAARVAAAPAACSTAARSRVIRAAVRDVSEVLGNTPTVARASYIDPRIFDHYLAGHTIPYASETLSEMSERSRRRLELAVLALLEEKPRAVAR